jgi:protein SCO1/2
MRAVAVVVVSAAALAAAAAAAVLAFGDRSSAPAYRGSSPPVGLELPEFTLRDEAGRLVEVESLDDKAVLVTFLDSQCREACPLIAGHVGRALDRLGAENRSRIAALAITTDPAEDTPASAAAFLRRYGAQGQLRYLLGSERELRPVWRAFAVLPSADTGRDDMHSAPVRIYDRSGTWVSTLHAGADLSPESVAHDLRLAAG